MNERERFLTELAGSVDQIARVGEQLDRAAKEAGLVTLDGYTRTISDLRMVIRQMIGLHELLKQVKSRSDDASTAPAH